MAIWPLLIWSVYIPNAEKQWQKEKKQYLDAQKTISEILTIDPERLDLTNSKNSNTQFDYAVALEKTATLPGIPSSKYKFNTGTRSSGKEKSQSASVNLKEVDIVKCAKFLSTIQFRWANLQCSSIKLKKKKGLPDIWDIDLDFKYYF